MNAFIQIALAWQCLRVTLRQIGRPALWAPWLVLGILQTIALALITGFAHPWVSAWMAPLVVRGAGPAVLHYPEVFRALPALDARGAFAIDTVFGVVLIGAATALFGARFDGRPMAAREGLGRGARDAGTLILVQLPIQLAILALTFGLEAWFAARGSAGLTRKLAQLVGQAAVIGLQASFLYVPALVVLGGHGPRGAWRELPDLLARGGIAALTLAVAVAATRLPFAVLTKLGMRMVDRGTPELMVGVVGAQLAAGLLVGFLIAGTATLLYQTMVVDQEEGW